MRRQQTGPIPPIGSNGSIAPEKGLSPWHSKRARSTSTPGGGLLPRRGHMQMETDSHPSPDSRGVDGAINRLRRDLLDTPPVTPEPDDMTDQPDEPDIIDYASVEFEVERMRKRLAVWEIFLAYMRGGARSWSQVQQAITPEDFDKIVAICDGVPLRDLLLDLR